MADGEEQRGVEDMMAQGRSCKLTEKALEDKLQKYIALSRRKLGTLTSTIREFEILKRDARNVQNVALLFVKGLKNIWQDSILLSVQRYEISIKNYKIDWIIQLEQDQLNEEYDFKNDLEATRPVYNNSVLIWNCTILKYMSLSISTDVSVDISCTTEVPS